MVSPPPKEYHVLTSYTAKLVNTVKKDVNNLLPYLVTAKIIQDNDEEYIKSIPRSSERVSELLRHISGPVNSGYTSSFYTLLDIMCNHGNDTTKQLAKEIKEQVEFSHSNSENDEDDYDGDDSKTSSGVQRKRRNGRDKRETEETAAKKRKQKTSPVQASSSSQSQDHDNRQQNTVERDQENASENSTDKKKKFNLFISYTHKDNTNDFAQRLHDDLENEGWEVFIDTRDIRTGNIIPQRIQQAIHKCNGMIIIYTKNYSTSDWCPDELTSAHSLQKKLYPLKRENIDYDCKSSEYFRLHHRLYRSFFEDDKYKESIKQLIDDIKKDANELGFS